MSHSSEEARVLAAAKVKTEEEASSPPVNRWVGAVQGKKRGARVSRVKQTLKAQLTALEAELEELHA